MAAKIIPFKHQDKASVTALVPLEIRNLIVKQSETRQQSIGLVTSEILCRGLGMDPAQFGIPVSPMQTADVG